MSTTIPTTMTLDRAYELNQLLVRHNVAHQVGAVAEPLPADVSLADWLTARDMVHADMRRINDLSPDRASRTVTMTVDPRGIAAAFALTHYAAGTCENPEVLLVAGGKALLLVTVQPDA